jgi:hypothetical protein
LQLSDKHTEEAAEFDAGTRTCCDVRSVDRCWFQLLFDARKQQLSLNLYLILTLKKLNLQQLNGLKDVKRNKDSRSL